MISINLLLLLCVTGNWIDSIVDYVLFLSIPFFFQLIGYFFRLPSCYWITFLNGISHRNQYMIKGRTTITDPHYSLSFSKDHDYVIYGGTKKGKKISLNIKYLDLVSESKNWFTSKLNTKQSTDQQQCECWKTFGFYIYKYK